jgi:CBS domain-containing protein
LRVSSFVNSSYPTVKPDDLLTNARALLRDLGLRMLPVVREDLKLEGVVTRRHVLMLSSTRSNALVRDVMDNPQLVFKPGEDARRAFHAMVDLDEWYVPVVSESTGKYVGVISLDRFLRDVLRRDNPAHKRPVSELMSRDVVTFREDDPVGKVWRKMVETGYGGFPVVRGRKSVVVGIVTEHDLLRKGYTRIELESEAGPRSGPKVREAMTSPAITVGVGETLRSATALMIRHDVGRLPVIDGEGVLKGLVDRSDAVRAYFQFPRNG